MRHQKIQRFGIRKYNVGLFSTVIGTLLFLGSQSTAFADETTHRESNVIATTIHESESDKEEADTPKPEEAITPLESETSDDTNTLNVKDEVLDYESKTETESEASEDDAKDKVEEKDKKDEETQEEKSEKEAKSDKEDEASKSEESQKEDTPKTEKAKAESREATEDSKPRRRGKRSLEANSLREATPPENNPIRKRSKRATNDPTPTQDRSNRHSFIYGDPNDPRTLMLNDYDHPLNFTDGMDLHLDFNWLNYNENRRRVRNQNGDPYGLKGAGLHQEFVSNTSEILLRYVTFPGNNNYSTNEERLHLSFRQPKFYKNIEAIVIEDGNNTVGFTRNYDGSNWDTEVRQFTSLLRNARTKEVRLKIKLKNGQTLRSLGFTDDIPVYVTSSLEDTRNGIIANSVQNTLITLKQYGGREQQGFPIIDSLNNPSGFFIRPMNSNIVVNRKDKTFMVKHNFQPRGNATTNEQLRYSLLYFKEQLPRELLPFVRPELVELFQTNNNDIEGQEQATGKKAHRFTLDSNGLLDTSQGSKWSIINPNAETLDNFRTAENNWREVLTKNDNSPVSFATRYYLKDNVTFDSMEKALKQSLGFKLLHLDSWFELDQANTKLQTHWPVIDRGSPEKIMKGS